MRWFDDFSAFEFERARRWSPAPEADALRRDTVPGTADAETLYGGGDGDLILGEGGDDRLVGRAGADTLDGGKGRDLLFGMAGADTLEGGIGRDTLFGDEGDDRLEGGDGGDSLVGGDGADTLIGGAGNDVLRGGGDGSRDVFVFGGADGEDRIRALDIASGVVRFEGGTSYGYEQQGRTAVLTFGDTVVRVHDADARDVMVDIAGVDEAPRTREVEAGEFDQSDPIAVDLLAHAWDPEGAALSVEDVVFTVRTAPGGPAIDPSDPLYAAVVAGLTLDGSMLEAEPDAFDFLPANTRLYIEVAYDIDDGATTWQIGSASLQVLGENDDPVAVDDTFTLDDDETVSFTAADLIANDSDVDGDTLQIVSLDTGSLEGALRADSLGNWSYDPNGAFDLAPGETVTDTLVYNLSDGNGGVTQGTVEFEVTGAPAPVEGWFGKEVRYDLYLNDSVIQSKDVVVGDGVETDIHSDLPWMTFDLAENQLIYSAALSGTLTQNIDAVFRDATGEINEIANVTIDTGATTMTTFAASRISFDDDFIQLDLQGLTFGRGTQLVLDIEFA